MITWIVGIFIEEVRQSKAIDEVSEQRKMVVF